MIHREAPRIEATSSQGRKAVFCSELCRDEFAALFGLSELGEWHAGGTGRARQ